MTVKPKTNGSEQNIRLSFLPIFSTIQPPSRPPTAAPTVTMDWTTKHFSLLTVNYQPSETMSYPEPGGLVCIQLQSRVSNGSEFRDDGRAVPQHKPETHGTQNWCKSGQVQLLVLHFTKMRIEKRAFLKGQRSVYLHIYTSDCSLLRLKVKRWLNCTLIAAIWGLESNN